jgi:hypothetical protein
MLFIAMKFQLYKQHGALNSTPIFNAFSQGIKVLGHTESQDSDSIPVIWSVLWAGRMLPNRKIYEHARSKNLPVIIIEVGALKRGISWKISVDHVNSLGYFGNDKDLNLDRIDFFGKLKPYQPNRNPSVLIATQRTESLQWQGNPSTELWIKNIITTIRSHTDRSIKIRPHPRSLRHFTIPKVDIEMPKKIVNSYDDFDFNYHYHCVINHNSGPSVQSIINGSPVICDASSLAYPMSTAWENIENPTFIDREEWYLKLCHTEWTIEEIAKGIPLKRLEDYLSQRLSNFG